MVKISDDVVFLFLISFLLIVTLVLSRVVVVFNKKGVAITDTDEIAETKISLNQYKNAFTFLTLFTLLVYVGHYFTIKYQAEAHVLEWLNLIVRQVQRCDASPRPF